MAILTALGILTSGCSISKPVDICPPLPANLEPDALKKMPRTQAMASIKDYFGIQLPPSVTYVDVSHESHSTSYKFIYSPVTGGYGGFTPWFTDSFEGRWGSKWGDVMIFETSFTHLAYNAYDIASVMTHEAAHAWQQHTLAQLAQDTQSAFMRNLENHSYYTYEWQEKFNSVLEYEASSYNYQHMPAPLCTSQTMRVNEEKLIGRYTNHTPVVGLEQSPWSMSGYPLP